jgi:hypothetical protein
LQREPWTPPKRAGPKKALEKTKRLQKRANIAKNREKRKKKPHFFSKEGEKEIGE